MRLVGEGERRPRGRRGDFKGSTIWRRSPQSSKRLRRRLRTRHHPPFKSRGFFDFSQDFSVQFVASSLFLLRFENL